MDDAHEHLDRTEIESFLATLGFVREYAINIVSAEPGQIAIELPFDERFSGPPGLFPASMVGAAGDVAAVSSCLSLLPRG
jgi:acyl-coenzyme A thioesterase PaaI-like protein